MQYDSPLQADIEGLARPISHWVKTSPDAQSVAADGAAAIAAARTLPGQIATLILPADTAWNQAAGTCKVAPRAERKSAEADAVLKAARILRSGEPSALLLTGRALRTEGLELAGRIAGRTGCKLLMQSTNVRIQRGVGRVQATRIPYVLEQAVEVLKGIRHLILVEAREPIAFFGYPNKPSELKPADCALHRLCTAEEDSIAVLEQLSRELGAKPADAVKQPRMPLDLPRGALTPTSFAAAFAALLPENAIIVDESITTGRGFFPLTASAAQHDWLQNMGGSIGYAMPVGIGAAVAAPDRKVICLIGDGSAMYTVQSLWTQAREGLDIITIIFANRAYQILKGELAAVGAGTPGHKAKDMLELDRPALDWLALAKGMGVRACSASTAEEFSSAFARALKEGGPNLIEVRL